MFVYFCEQASRIAKHHKDERDKYVRVVGMTVVSVKIGDHCYHVL